MTVYVTASMCERHKRRFTLLRQCVKVTSDHVNIKQRNTVYASASACECACACACVCCVRVSVSARDSCISTSTTTVVIYC